EIFTKRLTEVLLRIETVLFQNPVFEHLTAQKPLYAFLVILLCIQVAASPVAIYYEINYDFSAAKRTASFLLENDFINDETFIASYPSYAASAILPYLPAPHNKFYYLEYESYQSYMIWNMEWEESRDLSLEEIIDRVNKAIIGKNFTAVLVVLTTWQLTSNFTEKYDLIAQFTKTIVSSESFYIYQMAQTIY
ncbi:MAG: hypothetical protein ACFFBD_21205, partial [Candidatus Hodarchaeota archaeon]